MPLRCDCTPCCENILRVTSISNTGGSLFFVTNSTITPKNGCKYLLKIPCSILPLTALTTINQVYVVVNGANIPLQECLGNNVYTDQIRCMNKDDCGNIILRLVYGSTPTHFKIISQKLCCSNAYGLTAVTTAQTPVSRVNTTTSTTASTAAKKTVKVNE